MAILPTRLMIPRLLARAARPAPASYAGQVPYLPPDIQVTDVVDYTPVVPKGFPTPTNLIQVKVASASSAVPYTVQGADTGLTIQLTQGTNNAYGSDATASSTAIVAARQTYANMGQVCGNLAESTDPGHGGLFNNATFDGRGFMPGGQTSAATFTVVIVGNQATISGMSLGGAVLLNQQIIGSNIATGTIITAFGTGTGGNGTYTVSISQQAAAGAAYSGPAPYDANGFPTVAWTNVFSAGNSTTGVDGTLPAGTYHCSYPSTQGCAVNGGGSVNATVTQTQTPSSSNGWIGKYDIVASAGATVIVTGSAAIQGHDIPRDGSASSAGQPRFSSAALGVYAKLGGIRLMGMQQINGIGGAYPNVQQIWNDRPPYFPGAAGNVMRPYPPEILLEFANAVADYPGSHCVNLWWNFPGRALPDYAVGNATLFNAIGISSRFTQVELEPGNERWNNQFANTQWASQQALIECKVAATYGVTNQIAHIVTDGAPLGTATVTVTMLNAVSTYRDASGNPYILNAAQCVIACQFVAAPGWNAGTVASPATITLVDDGLGGTVAGGTTRSFTYVAPGLNPSTYPASTDLGTNQQWGAIFNLASTLVNDGLNNYNLFQMGEKYSTRQLRALWEAWQTVRPQATYHDKWVMGLAQYGDKIVGAGANNHTVSWEYAAFLSGGLPSPSPTANPLTPGSTQLSSWLWGASIAPYTICVADAISPPPSGGTGASAAAAFFTGSMSAGTLTASGVTGTIAVGQVGIWSGGSYTITGLGTGTGGAGTYTVSNTATVGSTAMASGTSTVVTINAAPSGITGQFAVGQLVSGSTTIPLGTTIASMGTSTGGVGTINLSAPAGPVLSFALSGQTVDSVFAQANGYISPTGTWGFSSTASNQLRAVRNHVYMCKKYGIHPVCYEAGPDLQAVPAVNKEVSLDARMGTFITSYLDMMYNNGIELAYSLSMTPANYQNTTAATSQAAWPYLQSFSDTTSPKGVALFGYGTGRNYGDVSGPDGSGTIELVLANFQAYSGVNKGSGGNTQCIWWTNNSVVKFAGGTVNIPRTRRYQLQVLNTSATGEPLDVYIDGALAGSVNSFAGGAASSAGSTVGYSSILNVNMTFGAHAIDVQTRTGGGTVTPGVASVRLKKY